MKQKSFHHRDLRIPVRDTAACRARILRECGMETQQKAPPGQPAAGTHGISFMETQNRKDRIMNFRKDTEISNLPPLLKGKFDEYLSRFGTESGPGKIEFDIKPGKNVSPESFRMKLTEDSATISASGKRGILYGAQTLLRLMETGFEPGTREETPLCSVRGVKLFLPPPTREGFENFRAMVDLMSRFRYNFLLLETGGAMEYKRHPEINEGWVEYSTFMNEYSGKAGKIQESFPWQKNSIHSTNGGGRVLTQEQIKSLLDYCREREIEVVPELPSLSHCDYLLTRHKDLAERTEDPYPDTACPNHPDYYPLLFDLIDETLELFRPERMHLGHDEFYTMCLCPKCRNNPAPELYANDIRRLHDYLHDRNVKMMIWGEKLLDAHFSDGTPCGGSKHPATTEKPQSAFPAVHPAIDLIPPDVEILHWYWSIDRKLEQEFTKRSLPVIFGNFDSASIPDWDERRKAHNFLGTCCSNWGTTDPITLQRNCILFEIAYAAQLQWGESGALEKFKELSGKAMRELYRLNLVSQGPGRFLEIVHSTTESRPYTWFVDGIFVDNGKDLLGHHVFRSQDGTELHFPVLWGTNITAENISLEPGPNHFSALEGKTTPYTDQYDLDRRGIETSFSAINEKRGGKTVCRCFFRLPDDGKRYAFAGFKPAPGFSGEVSFIESREFTAD